MYSEVLIAKYGGSRMNDAWTISLANFVSLPAKIIWPTAFFLKRNQFLYDFHVGCLPANLGVSTWIAFNTATSRLNIYFGIGAYMSIKIL